jgi:hypothetical protein
MPYHLIGRYEYSGRTCSLHIQGGHLKLKIEASGYEALVTIYQTRWHDVPQGCYLEQYFSSSY